MRMSIDSANFSVHTQLEKAKSMETFRQIKEEIGITAVSTKSSALKAISQEVDKLEKELHETVQEKMRILTKLDDQVTLSPQPM